MLRKNESGAVGALEVVLILVVVAILGFVGWRVYDASQNSDETAANTEAAQESRVSADEETKEDAAEDGEASKFANWKRYTYSDAGLTFKLPRSWKTIEENAGQQNIPEKGRISEGMVFEGPDGIRLRAIGTVNGGGRGGGPCPRVVYETTNIDVGSDIKAALVIHGENDMANTMYLASRDFHSARKPFKFEVGGESQCWDELVMYDSKEEGLTKSYEYIFNAYYPGSSIGSHVADAKYVGIGIPYSTFKNKAGVKTMQDVFQTVKINNNDLMPAE